MIPGAVSPPVVTGSRSSAPSRRSAAESVHHATQERLADRDRTTLPRASTAPPSTIPSCGPSTTAPTVATSRFRVIPRVPSSKPTISPIITSVSPERRTMPSATSITVPMATGRKERPKSRTCSHRAAKIPSAFGPRRTRRSVIDRQPPPSAASPPQSRQAASPGVAPRGAW